MSVANLITMVRLLLVPVIVWALLSDQSVLAFVVFVIAGLSDAVDGAVARTISRQTDLGTALDPVADKTLLVSVFLVLAYLGELPLWLVILIVSRDLLLVAGFMFAAIFGRSVTIRPLLVSKANTFAQIVLAAYVLAAMAFAFDLPRIGLFLEWTTGALTAISAVAYMIEGVKWLAAAEGELSGAGDEQPDTRGGER